MDGFLDAEIQTISVKSCCILPLPSWRNIGYPGWSIWTSGSCYLYQTWSWKIHHCEENLVPKNISTKAGYFSQTFSLGWTMFYTIKRIARLLKKCLHLPPRREGELLWLDIDDVHCDRTHERQSNFLNQEWFCYYIVSFRFVVVLYLVPTCWVTKEGANVTLLK